MVDLPLFGRQRGALSLICLVVALALIVQETSAAWGDNSTITLQTSRSLFATTDAGNMTSVKVSGPLFSGDIFTVGYVNTTSNANQLLLMQVDFSTPSIGFSLSGLSTLPVVNGSSSLLAFTATGNTGSGTASMNHVVFLGGRQRNDLTSNGNSFDFITYLNAASNVVPAGNIGVTFPNIQIADASVAIDRSVNYAVTTATSKASVPIYLFGGYNNDAGNRTITNEMVYSAPDTTNGGISSWDTVTPITDAPEARYQHQAVSINDTMYLFGGRNETGAFGDTWTFHFPTKNWTKLHDFGFVAFTDGGLLNNTVTPAGSQAPYSPPSRYAHSMLVMSDTDKNLIGGLANLIVLVGGYNGVTTFNDLWGFDPVTQLWQQINLPTSYGARMNTGIFTSYETDTDLYLFGGELRNGTITYYSDMWHIDLSAPSAPGPAFKRTANAIIAGVAGGIILVLIITVIVLKCTDRNSN